MLLFSLLEIGWKKYNWNFGMNFCFYIRWLTDQEDKLPESDNEDTIDSLKAKEDKIKVSPRPVGEENQILYVV